MLTTLQMLGHGRNPAGIIPGSLIVECYLKLIAFHISLQPYLVPWPLDLSRNGAGPLWAGGGKRK